MATRPTPPPTVIVPAVLIGLAALLMGFWSISAITVDKRDPTAELAGLGTFFGLVGLVLLAVLVLLTVAALSGWSASPWLLVVISVAILALCVRSGRNSWPFIVMATVILLVAVLLSSPSARTFRSNLWRLRHPDYEADEETSSDQPSAGRRRVLLLAVGAIAVGLTAAAAAFWLDVPQAFAGWYQTSATVTDNQLCTTVDYTPLGADHSIEAQTCGDVPRQVGETVTVWIDPQYPNTFFNEASSHPQAWRTAMYATTIAALLTWSAVIALWLTGRRRLAPSS